MRFGTDIHGSQTMNPNNFDDPLIVHFTPSSGQNIRLSNTLVYHPALEHLHLVS